MGMSHASFADLHQLAHTKPDAAQMHSKEHTLKIITGLKPSVADTESKQHQRLGRQSRRGHLKAYARLRKRLQKHGVDTPTHTASLQLARQCDQLKQLQGKRVIAPTPRAPKQHKSEHPVNVISDASRQQRHKEGQEYVRFLGNCAEFTDTQHTRAQTLWQQFCEFVAHGNIRHYNLKRVEVPAVILHVCQENALAVTPLDVCTWTGGNLATLMPGVYRFRETIPSLVIPSVLNILQSYAVRFVRVLGAALHADTLVRRLCEELMSPMCAQADDVTGRLRRYLVVTPGTSLVQVQELAWQQHLDDFRVEAATAVAYICHNRTSIPHRQAASKASGVGKSKRLKNVIPRAISETVALEKLEFYTQKFVQVRFQEFKRLLLPMMQTLVV